MHISDYLKQSTAPPFKGNNLKFFNERQYIIQQFVDEINKGREGTKFKPVTWKQINGMVAHLKGFELNHFFVSCKKAKTFSSYFFYKLKK